MTQPTTSWMRESDRLHRFVLEELGARGEIVRLDASWRAILKRHDYPAAVRQPLGEALLCAAMLSAAIKFDGTLTIQAQGDGPLHTLIVQATHDRHLRGLARWRGKPRAGSLEDLCGRGSLALTIEARRGERYQGIVPLEGSGLGAALENYFSTSEQLPTALWFAVEANQAAGLLLQRLPGANADRDGWNRSLILAETLTEQELLRLPVTTLLRRLFHEDDVRLFEGEPVAFRCGCSRERIAATLRALGRDELDSIAAEHGSIQVSCEFCNRDYRFDPVDVRELFTDGLPHAVSNRQH